MGFLRSLLIGALALALITHLWMLSDGGHPTPSGPTSGVARAIPEASAAAHDPSDQPDHSWGQMLQTCVAVLAVLLMAAWAPSLLGPRRRLAHRLPVL